MALTDDQVAALRAHLSARTDAEVTEARRQFLILSGTGRLDEVRALVYGASAAAARRRFSPTWTSADIVRFVADFRSSSAEAASLLSAPVAEIQLRRALSETLTTRPDEETRARALLILLAALTTGLPRQELDKLLSDAPGRPPTHWARQISSHPMGRRRQREPRPSESCEERRGQNEGTAGRGNAGAGQAEEEHLTGPGQRHTSRSSRLPTEHVGIPEVSRPTYNARPCPRNYVGDRRSDHCPLAA